GCGSGDERDELASLHGAAPSGRDIHITTNLKGTGEVPLENSQPHLDVLSVSGNALRDRDSVERAVQLPRNSLDGAMTDADFVSYLQAHVSSNVRCSPKSRRSASKLRCPSLGQILPDFRQ